MAACDILLYVNMKGESETTQTGGSSARSSATQGTFLGFQIREDLFSCVCAICNVMAIDMTQF